MFFHNFKYSFKTLLKNKSLIFWTFAFPIILGTLFSMAFSDIEKKEKLDIINMAIIDNQDFQENSVYQEVFKSLGDEENEDRLLNIKYVSENEAKELLKNNEVSGIFEFKENKPNLIINSNGINETVLKYTIEEIEMNYNIVKELAEKKINDEMMSGKTDVDLEAIYKAIEENVKNIQNNIEDKSSSNLSYTMIEFYTLIAMACLYSGMLGMASVNSKLANISSVGKRVTVSPTKKSKTILSSILASYIVSLIGISILYVYTIFVLKVDYGKNFPLIVLLSCLGCFAGLNLGIMIGTTVKAKENTKEGILLAVTMIGCFLSGMMGITEKYIIDTHIPILNKINPANMITDGLYSLYYYTTFDRYIFNIISLLIFSVLMIVISMISLRRDRYDSI